MEDAEKKDHIITTLLTMHQFHAEEKYYDVQLLVGKRLFKCLRSLLAANSQFFDTMFSAGNNNAATDQPITTLQEMDATAFEGILNFMYTGDISVTDTNNALQLLYLNDFLKLCTDRVKKKCIKHVKSRSEEPQPISNAFELFSFAYKKVESRLVKIMSAHICQHLYHYSKDARLMDELTFEMLNSLIESIKEYIIPLPGSQNVVVKIIQGWINHDPKGRAEYRSELMKNLDSFSLLLLKRLEKIADKLSNVPRDFQSPLSESQTPERELDINITVTNDDARLEGTLKFKVTKISKLGIGEKVRSSSSKKISNLSWIIQVRRSDTFLSVELHGAGLPGDDWKCCAVADFSVLLRGNEKSSVQALSRHRFFSAKQRKNRWNWGWRFPKFLKWSDVIDTEKGYIENDSITIIVDMRADLPFFGKVLDE